MSAQNIKEQRRAFRDIGPPVRGGVLIGKVGDKLIALERHADPATRLGKRIGLHINDVAWHLRRTGHEIVTGAEARALTAKGDLTGNLPVLKRS